VSELTRWVKKDPAKENVFWPSDKMKERAWVSDESIYEQAKSDPEGFWAEFANVLKGLGVNKGDRVGIYLPMIPEAIIAMQACARIGAPHSVVFSAFSPDSLRDRLIDAGAKVLITADGYWRRGKKINLN